MLKISGSTSSMCLMASYAAFTASSDSVVFIDIPVCCILISLDSTFLSLSNFNSFDTQTVVLNYLKFGSHIISTLIPCSCYVMGPLGRILLDSKNESSLSATNANIISKYNSCDSCFLLLGGVL